jgi:hypothetical protein
MSLVLLPVTFSMTFESVQRLVRIEEWAFRESELNGIIIPSSVEVIGCRCFSRCKSLLSVTFKSVSRLVRIEKWAFRETGSRNVVIPSSIVERPFRSAVWKASRWVGVCSHVPEQLSLLAMSPLNQ